MKGGIEKMKTIGFVSGMAAGLAAGMAAGVAAVTVIYPAVGKRMKRDGRKLWKNVTNGL